MLEIPSGLSFSFKPFQIRSSSVAAGDKCYSMGNATNLGISITEGIISNPLVEITISGIKRDLIQSDISTTSGCSGGALLDSEGSLIGITTLRLRDENGDIISGYGYSIPIELVNDLVATN